MDNFQEELDKRQQEQKAAQDKADQINAVNGSGDKVVGALKEHTGELTGSIHQLLMATLVSKDPKIAETAKNLAGLLGEIKNATAGIKGANFKPLADNLSALQDTLTTVPDKIAAAHAATDPTPLLKEIAATLGQKDFNPKITVPATKVDLSPLTNLLADIKTAVSKDDTTDTSRLEDLTQQVASAVNDVKDAIQNQTFPVPNFVLPFKDINGKATQVQLDSSGNIPTTGGGSGGGGTQYAEGTTTAPATGTVALGRYNTSQPTLTNGQLNAPQLDVNGNLKVNIASGGGSGGTSSSFGSTFPATGTAIGAKNGSNMVNLTADGSGNLDVNLQTAIPAGTNVIGHVIADTGSTTAVTQGTASNLKAQVTGAGSAGTADSGVVTVQGITSMTPLKTDGSATTQPVSGTVTANAGTNLNTSALALDATLTGGTQKSITRGGAKGTTTAADVTSSASGSNHQPLDVAIYDASGNQVTSFGGGTQYTNGATQATPTGTVALGYDGTNVRALHTAADGSLQVQLNAAQANTTGSITTSSSVVTVTDLTGVGSATIQISGTYAGVNVSFEASVDGTNFNPIAVQPIGVLSPTPVTTSGVLTTNSTNVWNVSPLLGVAEFRVRATAYTSGTASVIISPSAQFVQYQDTVNGSVVADTELASAIADGDGIATTTTAPVIAYPVVFNGGTTFDRMRGGQGDAASATGLQDMTPRVYNGSTYDRLRGDTTNGAFVNVTKSVPGVGATNLGKAEDAGHTSGDTGVFMLGVRNDANAAFSGTDQDYTPIGTDSSGRVYVVQKAPTATLTNVAGSATSVTLLSANNARIGATITNDSSSLIYIKFGTTASTTSYTVVLAGAASAPFSYYEVPAGYTGRIDAIWASATGNARITEMS